MYTHRGEFLFDVYASVYDILLVSFVHSLQDHDQITSNCGRLTKFHILYLCFRIPSTN